MNLPTHLISEELKIFENRFKEAMSGDAPLLKRILRYIVKRKGKQLRPMFVLLSARISGEINDVGKKGFFLHLCTLESQGQCTYRGLPAGKRSATLP